MYDPSQAGRAGPGASGDLDRRSFLTRGEKLCYQYVQEPGFNVGAHSLHPLQNAIKVKFDEHPPNHTMYAADANLFACNLVEAVCDHFRRAPCLPIQKEAQDVTTGFIILPTT